MAEKLLKFLGLLGNVELEDRDKNPEELFSVGILLSSASEGTVGYQPVVVSKAALATKDLVTDSFIPNISVKPVFVACKAHRKSTKPIATAVTNIVLSNFDKGIFSGKTIVPDSIKELNIKEIKGYVMSTGSIYVKVDNEQLIKTVIQKWLPESFSQFKYISKVHSHYSDNYSLPAAPILVLSFHDLRNAIPIFNKRKIDGMAMDISLCMEQETAYFNIARQWYLLSNYEENISYIDGEAVALNINVGTKSDIASLLERTVGVFHAYAKQQAPAKKLSVTINPKKVLQKDYGDPFHLREEKLMEEKMAGLVRKAIKDQVQWHEIGDEEEISSHKIEEIGNPQVRAALNCIAEKVSYKEFPKELPKVKYKDPYEEIGPAEDIGIDQACDSAEQRINVISSKPMIEEHQVSNAGTQIGRISTKDGASSYYGGSTAASYYIKISSGSSS